MKLTKQEQDALEYYRGQGGYSGILVDLANRLLVDCQLACKPDSPDMDTFSKLHQLVARKADLLSPEDRAYVDRVRGSKKPLNDVATGLLMVLDKVAPKPVEPSVSFHEALSDMCTREDAVYRCNDLHLRVRLGELRYLNYGDWFYKCTLRIQHLIEMRWTKVS